MLIKVIWELHLSCLCYSKYYKRPSVLFIRAIRGRLNTSLLCLVGIKAKIIGGAQAREGEGASLSCPAVQTFFDAKFQFYYNTDWSFHTLQAEVFSVPAWGWLSEKTSASDLVSNTTFLKFLPGKDENSFLFCLFFIVTGVWISEIVFFTEIWRGQ